MASTYPIQGIPTEGHQVPVRQEISGWFKSDNTDDKIQVSLFLRALDNLQRKDSLTDKLSFYQLATIHGYPTHKWDNGPDPEGEGSYCLHNSFLFPTWHRPYMLLYEQALYENMTKEVVDKIQDPTEKSQWEKAAKTWRLPFWDWAVPQADTDDYGVPGLVNQPEVDILKPGSQGGTESFTNPLYKFTNKITVDGKLTEVPMGDEKMKDFALNLKPFDKCVGTSRYGDPSNETSWKEGVENNDKITTALAHPNWRNSKGEETSKGSIADNVFRLLTDGYFQSYEPFSSTMYKEQKDHAATEFLSLEMIHNNIHNWTGGAEVGHMSEVAVASFDPIFWLHHCNVDRLLAIWQSLNPDKWFDNPSNEDPKPTDLLEPFHKDEQGHTYSSNDARNWEALHYTYPELVNTTKDELKELVKKKYGGTVNRKLRTPELPGINHEEFNDYIINIQYDRYALGGRPYTMDFSLEDADMGVSTHLGSVYNFSSQIELPTGDSCNNCNSQKKSGVLSKAQVPITLHLHGLAMNDHYGHFDDMNPEPVEKLLEKQLRWTVTSRNEQVDLLYFPNLLVTVCHAKAQFPTEESPISVFDPNAYQPLYKATEGQPTGAAPPSG